MKVIVHLLLVIAIVGALSSLGSVLSKEKRLVFEGAVMEIGIAGSALPLQSVEDSFAVDSSGFSTTNYVRWFDVKYGKNEEWHDWLKMHLMCGVKTHIVTSVEMSGPTLNDSQFYKPLLQQTAKAGFIMKEVSADKGYISMKNLQTTVDHGAVPFIPFKSNAHADRGTDVRSKMFFFYNYKRAEFWAHYHKRSMSKASFR